MRPIFRIPFNGRYRQVWLYIACDLFSWKQICDHFLLFVYIWIAIGDQIIRGPGWLNELDSWIT